MARAALLLFPAVTTAVFVAHCGGLLYRWPLAAALPERADAAVGTIYLLFAFLAMPALLSPSSPEAPRAARRSIAPAAIPLALAAWVERAPLSGALFAWALAEAAFALHAALLSHAARRATIWCRLYPAMLFLLLVVAPIWSHLGRDYGAFGGRYATAVNFQPALAAATLGERFSAPPPWASLLVLAVAASAGVALTTRRAPPRVVAVFAGAAIVLLPAGFVAAAPASTSGPPGGVRIVGASLPLGEAFRPGLPTPVRLALRSDQARAVLVQVTSNGATLAAAREFLPADAVRTAFLDIVPRRAAFPVEARVVANGVTVASLRYPSPAANHAGWPLTLEALAPRSTGALFCLRLTDRLGGGSEGGRALARALAGPGGRVHTLSLEEIPPRAVSLAAIDAFVVDARGFVDRATPSLAALRARLESGAVLVADRLGGAEELLRRLDLDPALLDPVSSSSAAPGLPVAHPVASADLGLGRLLALDFTNANQPAALEAVRRLALSTPGGHAGVLRDEDPWRLPAAVASALREAPAPAGPARRVAAAAALAALLAAAAGSFMRFAPLSSRAGQQPGGRGSGVVGKVIRTLSLGWQAVAPTSLPAAAAGAAFAFAALLPLPATESRRVAFMLLPCAGGPGVVEQAALLSGPGEPEDAAEPPAGVVDGERVVRRLVVSEGDPGARPAGGDRRDRALAIEEPSRSGGLRVAFDPAANALEIENRLGFALDGSALVDGARLARLGPLAADGGRVRLAIPRGFPETAATYRLAAAQAAEGERAALRLLAWWLERRAHAGRRFFAGWAAEKTLPAPAELGADVIERARLAIVIVPLRPTPDPRLWVLGAGCWVLGPTPNTAVLRPHPTPRYSA